jgi:hypothetical protein
LPSGHVADKVGFVVGDDGAIINTPGVQTQIVAVLAKALQENDCCDCLSITLNER